ncbi:uncharacterized protein LOC135819850 [Sycon ciliatum]|uniref:uncharacterized protein LOC135819850 n=1 Tax=Sycon ciliatum TaxID=27933 RepID=UPI0031F67CBA
MERITRPRMLAIVLIFGTCTLLIYMTGSQFSSGRNENMPGSVARIAQRRLMEVEDYDRKERGIIRTKRGENLDRSKPVKCNGTFWYRFGKPWRAFTVESLSFAFKTDRPDRKSVLVYGQSLDGVFMPGAVCYFGMVMQNNGSLLIVWRVQGAEESARIQLAGRFDDGAWHVVSVMAQENSLQIAVDHRQQTSAGESKTLTFNTSDHAVPGAHRVRVDSGVYFGGVLDTKSLLAYDVLGDTTQFNGYLSRNVHLNGLALDLERMRRGFTEDRAGPHLLDQLKYDPSGPLQALVPPRVILDDLPAGRRFPIVSAVSQNHAEELVDMVGSARKHMQQRGVVVYDIGLEGDWRRRIERLCNTTVRWFRTDLYGGQMYQLKYYMWKPIVVQAVIQEFGGALWADSSIRFQRPISEMRELRSGFGVVGFEPLNAGPTGAFTHDGTLHFLGVERREVGRQPIAVGTSQVWLDVPYVRNVVMRMWFRCSLDLKCMAPDGARLWPCDFGQQYSGDYIGCHRYDQSALGVVLYKSFKGTGINASEYIRRDPRDLEFVDIVRHVTHDFPVCEKSENVGEPCACPNDDTTARKPKSVPAAAIGEDRSSTLDKHPVKHALEISPDSKDTSEAPAIAHGKAAADDNENWQPREWNLR